MPSEGIATAAGDFNSEQAANEKRYRTLLRALSTFVWVADASGDFTTAQQGWQEYTGHGFDSHQGSGWIADVHPDDRPRVSEIWRNAVRSKTWYEVEWRCWHAATGTWRRCVTRGAPILNVDGSVREWVGAVRDIESDLDVDRIFEREWLRQVQQAAGLAFWDYDPASREAWWTADVYRLYRAPLGMSYQELDNFIHPEDRERIVAARDAISTSGSLDVTFRIVWPSGEVRWLRSKGAKVRGRSDGHVAGAVIDVTEERELHESLKAQTRKLAEANRDLEFANEQLKQFTFAASHDLRAPLRQLTIFTELLARRMGTTADSKINEYLEQCRTGAVRMRKLLDDLLVYSQVAGPAETAAGPADSGQALIQARDNLAELIADTGTEIETGGMPEVAVEHVALVHLFQNLLSNAMKYRNRETPRIRIWAVRDNEFWRFHVQDNGIGIDPRYHATVFGVFKRLNPDREHEGSGIGLAICQKIVERRGGRIWVESEVGKGATFCFTLPAAGGS